MRYMKRIALTFFACILFICAGHAGALFRKNYFNIVA